MSKHLPPEVRILIEKESVSMFKDEERCAKCGQCRDVCRDHIRVPSTYNLLKTGDTAARVNCGQYANVCSAESIGKQPECGIMVVEVMNPDKIVVVSTFPSVRVALGGGLAWRGATLSRERWWPRYVPWGWTIFWTPILLLI